MFCVRSVNNLKYFLTAKKNKGYFIFRVEGINFDSKPIEIFGVKFYNPQRNKYLKYFNQKEDEENKENLELCVKVELFQSENESITPVNVKNSKCNAIVPIEYLNEDVKYFDSYKYPTKSFIEAFSRAQISFIEFKRYLNSFSTEYFFNNNFFYTSVSKESILADINFNYHKASNFKKSKEIVFKMDDISEVMIAESLRYKESIKFQDTFFQHIANSNALISKYSLENYEYSFKSLWIECLEPYFNSIDEFIIYAKKSVKIRNNFFSKYRILLMNALKCSNNNCYCLKNEELENIGIGNVERGELILGNKLEKNFNLLPNGSILDEFKEEMRSFAEEESELLGKIDLWVSENIKITYDERNIEVHYNLIDYYNNISIKKDVLFIFSCVIGAINDAIFSNNAKDIIEAKKYIDKIYLEKSN